ncbi:MAG: ankyrin repeat domain-containing protein [Parachlamydia sp.]|nr:ankyrin repeat domain-containing protein [Parachlamydia sp.]
MNPPIYTPLPASSPSNTRQNPNPILRRVHTSSHTIQNITKIVLLIFDHLTNQPHRDRNAARHLHASVLSLQDGTLHHFIEALFQMELGVDDDATLLHVAAKNGHVEAIKDLIGHGADVNQTIRNGNTPLHIASLNGRLAVTLELIESGTDVKKANLIGATPLHLAARNGHAAVILALLEHGAPVDSEDNNGWTPLHYASENGHEECIVTLIENGADVNQLLSQEWTPLHIACINGHVKAITTLLDNGADVNSLKKGFTPLHVASFEGYADVADILCDDGAEHSFDKNGDTPLHLAARKGHGLTVEVLIDCGANLNLRNRNGCTALHEACQHGQIEVIKILIEFGADPNMPIESDGATPLCQVVRNGHLAATQILINRGASVDKQDLSGQTPLFAASQRGYVACIWALLAAKAQINLGDNTGCRPLHIASQNGHVPVIRALVAAKARINIQDTHHSTPLHKATQGQAAAVYELMSAGADLHRPDIEGNTPLHLALLNGCRDAVHHLMCKEVFINVTNLDGETPLFLAAKLGDVDWVIYFTAANADLNRANTRGYTPLHIATEKGHIGVVILLLAFISHVNVNRTDKYGSLPLHVGAYGGNSKIVQLLIDAGSAINQMDYQGNSPLHLAAINGHLETAQVLIQGGALLNRQNNCGCTPLHLAVQRFKGEVALALIRAGADIKIEDNTGQTALHLAAKEGYIAAIRFLIEAGAAVNVLDPCSRTPLHWAVINGQVDAAMELIRAKADTNHLDEKDSTPLITAVRGDNSKMIRLLIEGRADINKGDSNGRTPLHVAVKLDKVKSMKVLIDLGADINRGDSAGCTPLQEASRSNNLHVLLRMVVDLLNDYSQKGLTIGVKNLLTMLSDINLADEQNNFTPLHWACHERYYDAVVALLDNGADVNRADKKGRTPLHVACSAVDVDALRKLIDEAKGRHFWLFYNSTPKIAAVRLLIDQGADVNRADEKGCTPLHVACRAADVDTVWLLIEKGAEINRQDKDGCSPLHMASSNPAILRILIINGAKVDLKNIEQRTPLENISAKDIVTMFRDIEYKIQDFIGLVRLLHPCVTLEHMFHFIDRQRYDTLTSKFLEELLKVKLEGLWFTGDIADLAIQQRMLTKPFLYTKEEREVYFKIYLRVNDRIETLRLHKNLFFQTWAIASGNPEQMRLEILDMLDRIPPSIGSYEMRLNRSQLKNQPKAILENLCGQFSHAILSRLWVKFEGEPGIDAGGLSRQFIDQLFLEISSIIQFRCHNGFFKPLLRAKEDVPVYRNLGNLIMFCMNSDFTIGTIYDTGVLKSIIHFDLNLLESNLDLLINFDGIYKIYKMINQDNEEDILMLDRLDKYLTLNISTPDEIIEEVYTLVEDDLKLLGVSDASMIKRSHLHTAIKCIKNYIIENNLKPTFFALSELIVGMRQSHFNHRVNFRDIQKMNPIEFSRRLQGTSSREDILNNLEFVGTPLNIQEWLQKWINEAQAPRIQLFLFAITGTRSLGNAIIKICLGPSIAFHTCFNTLDLDYENIREEKDLYERLKISLDTIKENSGFDMA